MVSFRLVVGAIIAVLGAGTFLISSKSKKADDADEDVKSSTSPSTAHKTPMSSRNPAKQVKSHPLADLRGGSRAVTLVNASSLASFSAPAATLKSYSVADIVYKHVFSYLPKPGPVLLTWLYVLTCRGEILRTAGAMLAELEALSVLSASFCLPEEAVFPAGATVAFFRALIASYPQLNHPDIASVMYALECHVKRAYSRRHVCTHAPLLLEAPCSALVLFRKSKRNCTSKAHLALDISPSAGDGAIEEVPTGSGSPSSPVFSPSSPTFSPSSPEFSPSSYEKLPAEEPVVVRHGVTMRLVIRSSINYWAHQMAKRMGFYRLAGCCLDQAVADFGFVAVGIKDMSTTLGAEEVLAVCTFAADVIAAQTEWLAYLPLLENAPVFFSSEEETLANAVALIWNLSAGALDFNEATKSLLVESCDMVTRFLKSFLFALETSDVQEIFKGMIPFGVVQDCVALALESIEVSSPEWFACQEVSQAATKLKVIMGKAAAMSAGIQVTTEPISGGEYMNQEEDDIASFMAGIVDAAVCDNAAAKEYPCAAPAAASNAAPATCSSGNAVPEYTSDAPFGSSKFGFAFESAAACAPPVPAAADGDATPAPAPAASTSGFESAVPAFKFASTSGFKVERQDSGNTSGECTPLSESGSVFGFGPASANDADAGGTQKATRRTKLKRKVKK